MKLVSGIIDSGFFAQSALSAEVATKDNLGRNISETYLTGVDLTPYQPISGMTAYQPVGSYLTANALDNVSGNWNQVSAKLDTSVYASDSGNFLTGLPSDLVYTADIADMATTAQVADKLDTSIYAAASGSFLTAHQSLPNSANWDSTYNTVATNSASWGAGITVATGSI